jgi:hypothetical protein
MILISHRGNLSGRNEETENSISSVDKALSLGLDVEIDVWYVNNKYYLGHDKPIYNIDIEYLTNPKLWCHAKNTDALLNFRSCEFNIHYFWHQEDNFTITSKGYIWSHMNMPISPYSICVLPEQNTKNKTQQITNSLGICSDQILLYIDLI